MVICPSCGKENPDGFAFCGYCTAPLAEQRPAPGLEERKIVSVLFCDLVGFTAASEEQDPEDVRARIRPYHARLRQEIERYGGTVEKFIGDAVMAVFGAPVAHEDDAERAVGAAPINGIAVSEATYRATDRIFDYEELEPAAVKGKPEPLTIFRPLASRARFGSDVTRTHATPLVGRELEKSLL